MEKSNLFSYLRKRSLYNRNISFTKLEKVLYQQKPGY